MSVVPSAATLVIKALKESKRDRKKMKNIKHNRNIYLDDIVETAKVTCPRYMAKVTYSLTNCLLPLHV